MRLGCIAAVAPVAAYVVVASIRRLCRGGGFQPPQSERNNSTLLFAPSLRRLEAVTTY